MKPFILAFLAVLALPALLYAAAGDVPVSIRDSVLLPGDDQTNNVKRIEGQFAYETVAASQTTQMLGSTGAAGDLIKRVVCVTTAASAAVVTLKDGTLTAFNIFHIFAAAGTFVVDLEMVSTDGGWQLTTSTNTTCIAIGRFT